MKGKLPYMAPEQIRGESIDGRADVFSLGVCTWEALAGERLFDRSTDFQIWKAITEEDPPTLGSRWPAERIGDFANRVGAFVAGRLGALPQWTAADLEQFTR